MLTGTVSALLLKLQWKKRMPQRMVHTVNLKSYLMFLVQFDCRFMTALSFCLSGDYSFTLTNHEGQIQFKFSLKSYGLEPSQCFLRILAYLMFGDDADIGLDYCTISVNWSITCHRACGSGQNLVHVSHHRYHGCLWQMVFR